MDEGYTSAIDDFVFMDGIFDLCRVAVANDYLVIVVTNQAGIGRGFYTETDFWKLTDWMVEQFAAREIKISEVYFCPYHAEYGVGEYKKESFDRKPNPGMLLKAALNQHLSMPKSIMIGDKASDMHAAYHAGVGIRCQFLHHQNDQPCSDSTHAIYELTEALSLLTPG